MRALASSLGCGNSILRSNRPERIRAGSRMSARLVAAITYDFPKNWRWSLMVQNRYNYHYMQCHIPLNFHLWHQNKYMTVQDWLPQRGLSSSYNLHARKLTNPKTSLKQNPTNLKCFSNLNPVITTKTIKLIEQFQHSPLHLPISTHFTVVNWKGFKSGKLLMN